MNNETNIGRVPLRRRRNSVGYSPALEVLIHLVPERAAFGPSSRPWFG